MTAGTTPAAKPLIPRIKYWLDLYKVYGMATESSIEVLHFPDIFLIGLSGALHPHAAFLLQLASCTRQALSICWSVKGRDAAGSS